MKTKRIIFYILFSIILFSCENKKVEIKKVKKNGIIDENKNCENKGRELWKIY